MIEACAANGVKLMVAYRLHFEEINLNAIDIVRRRRIGEPKFFNSSFSLTVREGNIRTKADLGGGTLYDIGIYCINAARGLFREEPIEARAVTCGSIGGVEESVSCVLRFPNERLASFICSFGAADVSEYRLAGTKGDLAVEPAYEPFLEIVPGRDL